MADEITLTSHNDTYLAAEVRASLVQEIRPNNTLRKYMDEVMVSGSNVYQWPIQADPGAATAKTEATDRVNTATTTTSAQATVATVGIMFSPTDEVRSASLVELVSWTASMAKRSVWEKLETDLAALLDDGSNATSTAGVDASVDGLLEAASQLVIRDITGRRVFVGSPAQYTRIQRDMASSMAIYTGAQASAAVNFGGDGRESFVVAGIECSQTSTAHTANGAADDVGAVFIPNHTFGLAVANDPIGGGAWLGRVETQRDASNNLTEIVCTGRYGGVMVRDGDFQEYLTDDD